MKIPPWSYSSLTKYETCPRQYRHLRVLKDVVDPPTEHTRWGNEVHQALEHRVVNKKPLPEGMQQWERIAAKFDNPQGRVFTETKFALTRNLTPCAWTAETCWVRGIIDVGVDAGPRVLLADWKTGKVKHDTDQLKLFAALYMQAKPYVEQVKTAFIWLAHNKLTKEHYTREHLPDIWEDFIMRSERLKAAFERDKWPAKPSGLCKNWCPVPFSKCEFSGRS